MAHNYLVQSYKIPFNFNNYIHYGMALRALGQGFIVKIFTSESPSHLEIAKGLKSYFQNRISIFPISPGSFSKKTPMAYEASQPSLLILDRVSYAFEDSYAFEEMLFTLINERDPFAEVVIFDHQIPESILGISSLITQVDVQGIKADMNNQVYAEIVTGNGKGKTTYGLGKALFYALSGTPSLVIQFIKSPKEYGEIKASARIPMLTITSMGKGFPQELSIEGRNPHREAAREAWRLLIKTLNRPSYGLLVLDEINIALDYGYIEVKEVERFLLSRPFAHHIILTGRYAKEELYAHVDRVLDMKEIMHPYKKGIKARKGIEY